MSFLLFFLLFFSFFMSNILLFERKLPALCHESTHLRLLQRTVKLSTHWLDYFRFNFLKGGKNSLPFTIFFQRVVSLVYCTESVITQFFLGVQMSSPVHRQKTSHTFTRPFIRVVVRRRYLWRSACVRCMFISAVSLAVLRSAALY